jgi:hypothetical protein
MISVLPKGNVMKDILLRIAIALFCFGNVYAQKVTDLMGDSWTGEITSTNDTTSEIALQFNNKGKIETFVGVLGEGYRVKMKDGSIRELKPSLIPTGTRIRVFYISKRQDVGGQKVKINSIYYIDFLSGDKYEALRIKLNIAPSTQVTFIKSGTLPDGNPLRVYLAIEATDYNDLIVDWVSRWNKGDGEKYGAVEVVPELSQADVALVYSKGTQLMEHRFQIGNMYLVVPKATGLEVLWETRAISSTTPDRSQGTRTILEKEMEKRMKARDKVRKK